MANALVLTRRDLLKTAAAAATVTLGRVLPGGTVAARGRATGSGVRACPLERWEYYRGTLGGIWEVWRGDKASDNVPWLPVQVPHCVNASDAVDPDAKYYQGHAWYRTTIAAPPAPPGTRTLLCFEGAGQAASVWVHSHPVGGHIGGYDEWAIDITDVLPTLPAEVKGQVPVAVLCDNSRDLERIPSSLSDFNLYGGLYRKVHLVQVPQLSIERVLLAASARAGRPASVEVRARLYNPASHTGTVTVRVRIVDPSGREVLATSKTLACWNGLQAIAQAALPAPVSWSPSTPALYRCEVTLAGPDGDMSVEERFGLRDAEWVPQGPFRLNGSRLLIRGTQRHEDHAGLGAAMSDDLIRREMRMIKDLGANFVRLGHHQQSRLVLDLCDELGLMVWEEIPWCRGGLGGERYRAQARAMLRSMIDQHFNHPSIILWGLGNENDWPGDFEDFDQEKIKAFMAELNDLAHRLDPSRQTVIRRCDFCKDIPDVYSPSIWAGWYRGQYTEYRASTELEMKRVRHFFHAEWGGDSHAGRHSEDPDRLLSRIATGQGTDERGLDYLLNGGQTRASRDGDWSESYICNLFDWHLKEQETMPWLTGAAQWIFKDFSTPLRAENPIPRMNQKGLVERDLTPKEGYFVFQSYWSPRPMVHIYGHSWPVRWGDRGELKLVKVYSNCQRVELFVNGVSAGARTRNSQDFPAAGLRWMVALREGDNVIRAVAAAPDAGPAASDEIRFRFTTEPWGPPARLQLREADRDGDTVRVEATVADAKGRLCLDSRLNIRFSLAGAGRLIDNLGTAGGSRQVELANGRASIRLLRQGGVSVLGVAARDVPAAFLRIEARFAAPDVAAIERARLLPAAEAFLSEAPVTVTASRSPRSAGGPHDFFSEADYWWPDPANPEGPYVQRDGLSNPANFVEHRRAMIRFSTQVATLTSAYLLTGDERFAAHAISHLRAWFVTPATRMNPSLLYAQAIKGRATGRGTGIIDTVHLVEVARAAEHLARSASADPAALTTTRRWFADYLAWLTSHDYGVQERDAKNNHGTCFVMQVAAFAHFTGDSSQLAGCRLRFKDVLVPTQMAADGSFPLELKRTKPYGYSIFNLDAFATICQILSTADDDLWTWTMPDGRGMRKAMQWLVPYLRDKAAWPAARDVMYFDEWPVRQPSLLFAGLAYRDSEFTGLWESLNGSPATEEVIRNLPVRHPLLWVDMPSGGR